MSPKALLELRGANGFRAQEAELLRVKAAALAGFDPDAAEAIANESLSLARTIRPWPRGRPRLADAWRHQRRKARSRCGEPILRTCAREVRKLGNDPLAESTRLT